MESTPSADAAPPSRRGLAFGIGAGMLVVGAAVGALVIGPRLGASTPTVTEITPHGDDASPAPGGHLFTVDGLIVNPAGSRGQHHLVVTVAFEVADAAAHARLKTADIPLRDAIAAMLERRTMDELTSPGIRDRLRTDLSAIASPFLGGGTVRVFLPQYIVQ